MIIPINEVKQALTNEQLFALGRKYKLQGMELDRFVAGVRTRRYKQQKENKNG